MLLLGLLAGCQAAPRDEDVQDEVPGPEAHHWVGEDGRTVIHRGVNLAAGAKWTEDHLHAVPDADVAALPAGGFTLARYLVFWQAAEPQKGQWDEDYLAGVREDLEELDALGLKVILDVHQDLYGEGFASVGLPRWTCDEAFYEAYTHESGSWFLNYLDPALVACFDHLWTDEEVRADYAALVGKLALEFRDVPAVDGVDLINEPYWGSATRTAHDEALLPAFYRDLVDAGAPVAPDWRWWLAPSVAANLDGSPVLDLSGFEADRVGVAPHFYPLYAEAGTGWDGTFVEEAATLGRLADHAEAQGVPLFLGEFGIFSEDGNEGGYARAVLDEIEGRGGSTAWWAYDRGTNLLADDGSPGPAASAWTRPYAHQIPGRYLGQEDGVVRFELVGDGVVTVFVGEREGCTFEGDGVVGVEGRGLWVDVAVEGAGEEEVRWGCP